MSVLGRIIWITGRPATGKTTLARALLKHFAEQNIATLWLDSDDLREVLTPNATYSDPERDHFYQAIGHLALLGAAGGTVVVVSATASKRSYRDDVRRKAAKFTEIWLTAEREVLRTRDIKGLYAKSHMGEIENLPGVGASYETPLNADIVVDTGTIQVAEALVTVLKSL